MGAAPNITTKARFDASGGLREFRDLGATGADAATTLAVDYIAGGNTDDPACGNKPQWAGLPCWAGTAGAPTGTDLPDQRTTRYTMWLAPAEVVEESGPARSAATRITTTTYLADGRSASSVTVVAGFHSNSTEASASAEPKTVTVYSPTTGMTTGIQTVASNGSILQQESTTFDLWGREISATNSLGDNTTTTYKAPGTAGAGMVAAITDPKGTVTFTYDGVDALGNQEQRGLVTSMQVSGVGTYTAAYDDQAALVLQTAPGNLRQSFQYDDAGQLVSQSYEGTITTVDPDTGVQTSEVGSWLTWSREYDISGRVVSQTDPMNEIEGDSSVPSKEYTYDRASRLIKVKDHTGRIQVVRATL